MGEIIYHPRSRWIYFEFVKFHEKLFKAQKIQHEFNENQNEFKVEDELQKLQEVSSTTFKQTKEFGNKLDVLEKNSETTSEQSKELRNKLEELERNMKSNFETTCTQTKELDDKLEKLDDKLEEILKLLKRE